MACLPLDSRIVVTGLGQLSASGSDIGEMLEQFRRAESPLAPMNGFELPSGKPGYVGNVTGWRAPQSFTRSQMRNLDRGTQLGYVAACQALAQAGLVEGLRPAGVRIGITVGISGASQYQNFFFSASTGELPRNRRFATWLLRVEPQFQASWIAKQCRLHGPQLTYPAASLGSALALAGAAALLQDGKADAMLVGGAEIHTLANALGMDSLGVTAEGRCNPFGDTEAGGMSFGEGAAYVVVETLASALDRKAEVLAELVSFGFSADAYSDVGNDPSGAGMLRAMRTAFSTCDVEADEIRWVRACGTGKPDQDMAELYALTALFGEQTPPVTSTEPFFGHVNGVSPLLGVVAGIAGMRSGTLPSLLRSATAGSVGAEKLNFLDSTSPPQTAGPWLVSAVAFGDNNAALVFDQPRQKRQGEPRSVPDILITGCGCVSALGFGVEAFWERLHQQGSALSATENEDFDTSEPMLAATIDSFPLNKLLRQKNRYLRRCERLIQFAVVSTEQALLDAGWNPRQHSPERTGLLMALSQGAISLRQQFIADLASENFGLSESRNMLRMARFVAASELARSFGLKGYMGTVTDGVGAGLQALVQGCALLRASPHMDSLLVVAADQISASQNGWFKSLPGAWASPEPPQLGIYDASRPGTALGEGAAAILLQKRDALKPGTQQGKNRIRVAGTSATSDAMPGSGLDPKGRYLGNAIDRALTESNVAKADLDLVQLQGYGINSFDSRELNAYTGINLSGNACCLTPKLGLCLASGALFSVVTAVQCMIRSQVPGLDSPVPALQSGLQLQRQSRCYPVRQCLISASSERGANSAVVLAKQDASD